ncbi:MAG: DUF4430 domain-containing protein [Syntrophomonadaceae bacterium]|nr:DUF4430 domain-containing protein [Syntrophomonadaceae bacterium]
MYKKSILAVFLIMLLLLAGCNVSRETSVEDRQIQTKSVVNKPVRNAELKQASNKVLEPAQKAQEKVVESTDSEPKSEKPVATKSDPEETAQVHLLVTRDYGEAMIFNQWVQVQEQQDALSLTTSYLDVKTSYGGSFVNSINGLESGYTGKIGKREKSDWFLYFNGLLAGKGAGDIKVKRGDVVWWDYHDWGSSTFTPAMIGAFPHPFTNGVVLAYSASARNAADLLATGLGSRGIEKVQLQKVNDAILNKRHCPVIVLGLRGEIIAIPAIQALNSNPQRTGLFCSFTDSGFKLLNAAVQEEQIVEGGDYACIEATASGMGDTNPLWLAVAEDERGLERAVSYLNQGKVNPDCGWGVVLGPQGLTPLPPR